MKGRRNRLEIMGEILELACVGETTKTGIAYRTNLGFSCLLYTSPSPRD